MDGEQAEKLRVPNLTSARQQVIALRTTNPCMTCASIGGKVGVSRERVRQILDMEGLSTRVPSRRQLFTCLACGKTIEHKGNKMFCDRKCEWQYSHGNLVCSNCGKEFTLWISDLKDRVLHSKSGLLFCKRRCFGQYMGKKYGFGAFPEHAHRNRRKWDYDKVIELHSQGLRYKEIADKLDMPYGTVSNILYRTRHNGDNT